MDEKMTDVTDIDMNDMVTDDIIEVPSDNDSLAEEAEENETKKSDNDSSAEEVEEKEKKRSDNDSSAEEAEENETKKGDNDPSAEKNKTKKRPWEPFTGDGIKPKRKKKEKGPIVKSLKIRKFINPRNAIVCLNELCKSVQYNKEQNGGQDRPYVMTAEIGNKKYRGFGVTKNIAKATAAEAALSTFVKPVASTEEDSDETPWASLASFAIYKLFHMWLHGRIGMGRHPKIKDEPYGGPASEFPLVTGANNKKIGNASNADNFTGHLSSFVADGGSQLDDPPKKRQGKMPNPLKEVPDNAATIHPVSLLHQMHPGCVEYDITKFTTEGIIHFAITCNVNGQIFTGEGGNIRKAKFNLAKTAVLEMYGVENVFELPAS